MKITLKFIPSDFTETNFMNYRDCAITRALARAGCPNWCDAGVGIEPLNSSEKIVSISNSSYKKLVGKVLEAYHEKSPVKKFQHTLIF